LFVKRSLWKRMKEELNEIKINGRIKVMINEIMPA
jgi:hypothetical protein